MRNPYDILGVSRSVDEQEIKKAYRKLAKQLHPDLHPGDAQVENRFKEVSAAYKVLGDKEMKARFDRGEIDNDGNQRAPHFDFAHGRRGGRGFGFSSTSGLNAEDIFGEFGDFFDRVRGGRRAGPRKGADRSYKIAVDFLDAAQGLTRRINIPGGKTLDVNIPAGIDDGRQIRLRGQGDAGSQGGPAGDALIEVAVKPHAFFRREGADIRLDLPIALGEAVLGAKIQVPTITGLVTVTIPKNANTGRTLRLKGKGIKRADGGAGDQYITLNVMLPDKSDAALHDLIEDWAKDNSYNPREGSGLE